MVTINKQYMRKDTPLVGEPPYGQIHLHSTGNSNSTALNEAMNQYNNRPQAFFTHVVGNGKVYQTAPTNRGAYDVGGGWNQWSYASIELIESHKTKAEFERDYKIFIDLARQLAKEGGIRFTLDEGNLGFITHDYARYTQPNSKTDHVDPYPYLKKWGITKAQLVKDLKNGVGGSSNTFDISKYYVAKDNVKMIKMLKGDYAYKEPALKNRDRYAKKGEVFTVVDVVYSGKYPRFKLKSGLYVSTRKDIVQKYK